MAARGAYLRRIGLFLATNLAVIVLLGVVLRLLGIERILDERGVALNYEALLAFSAVLGFTGSFISLALSKTMAKLSTRARVIRAAQDEREAWLLSTVGQLARRAGIGMPEVAIFPSPEPNAFATGMRRNAALVAVSEGLLQRMNRSQVEAVLAHEVAHVANGDMVTMALLQGVLNTFVVFVSRVVGYVVDRTVFRTERGHGPGFYVTAIVAELLLGLLATIIAMWFSRRREFRADAGAAQLTSRESMASALAALARAQDEEPLPDAVAAFGIRGGGGGGLRALFRSHPPIQARIAALMGEDVTGAVRA